MPSLLMSQQDDFAFGGDEPQEIVGPGVKGLDGLGLDGIDPARDLLAQDAGGPAGAAAPRLTIPEVVAKYEGLFDDDDKERALVFESGPLDGMTNRLCAAAEDTVSKEIAALYITQLKRAAHGAHLSTPVPSKSERSQSSLEARLKMLQAFDASMKADIIPMADELGRANAPGISDLSKMLEGSVRAEKARIESMLKNMTTPSIGSVIFDGIRGVFSSAGNTALVGDVRRHRNQSLVSAMDEMTQLADEIKGKTGDANFERTDGVLALRRIQQLNKEVSGLTKDVEGQVDAVALRNGLESVRETLDQAVEKAADDDFKQMMKDVAERMKAFIDALVKTLGRVFGANKGSHEAPKPA